MKKFALTTVAAATAFVGGLADSAPAVSKELKFASFVGGRHVINRKVFTPWTKEVEKLSGGSLKIKMYLGGSLGKGPAKQFKRAIDGVADITWGLQGYTSKQFRLTTLIEMPQIGKDAVDVTRRMWAATPVGLSPTEHASLSWTHISTPF